MRHLPLNAKTAAGIRNLMRPHEDVLKTLHLVCRGVLLESMTRETDCNSSDFEFRFAKRYAPQKHS